MSAITQVAAGLALPWFYTGVQWLLSRAFPGLAFFRWAGLGRELTFSAVSAAVVLSVWRYWYGVPAAGVMGAAGIYIWWHRRKKRRRAAAVLGAKSKALRDALVRRARQSGRPRPVLRPVPGGAR